MSIVAFNPAEFRDLYPRFMDFSDAQFLFAFDVACLLVDNRERSTVPHNPPEETARKTILHLLVCHLCELESRGGGIAGALSGAMQGSVSASFAPLPAGSADAAWYMQTQCGATAWMLMRGYVFGGRLYGGERRALP